MSVVVGGLVRRGLVVVEGTGFVNAAVEYNKNVYIILNRI